MSLKTHTHAKNKNLVSKQKTLKFIWRYQDLSLTNHFAQIRLSSINFEIVILEIEKKFKNDSFCLWFNGYNQEFLNKSLSINFQAQSNLYILKNNSNISIKNLK